MLFGRVGGSEQSLMDQNEMDGPVFKIANDPRITKIGRFLRKTSLDELPQFFNVLLGDMSIVDGNNNIPEYGETITVHFDLNNVGNDNAENVLMSLTVDSPYINVINGQDQVGVIEAHGYGRAP